MELLLLALFSVIPHEPSSLVDWVDWIERNHVHSWETGSETVDQVIYWAWDERTSGHRVVAWRIAGGSVLYHSSGRVREVWRDGGNRRVVEASRYVETWTWEDVEIEDRDRLPVDRRRGLRRPVAEP